MLHDTTNDGTDFEFDFPGISIIYYFGDLIRKDMVYLDYEREDSESEDYAGRHWMRNRRWETRSYDAAEDSYDDTSDPWYTDESSPDESEGSDDII